MHFIKQFKVHQESSKTRQQKKVRCYLFMILPVYIPECNVDTCKPEDHWSGIAHLSAEDMLKSAVIE